MKIRSQRRRHEVKDENPSLDISSLIDVSFLLLIYFIITSTLDPKEGDLKLSMIPDGGSSPTKYVIDTPTISVDEAGVIYFEEEMLDINVEHRELVMLLDRLQTYSDANWIMHPNTPPKVKVKVSDEAKGQRFVDVMNCLAEVGISNVTFLDME